MDQERPGAAPIKIRKDKTAESLTTILQELRALREAVSTLSGRIDKMENKLSQAVSEFGDHESNSTFASQNQKPPVSPEVDARAEQNQTAAQKDSPEYQAWLGKIAKGNGAVLYQRPIFETDQDGNVVYQDGHPRVINNQDLFNLVNEQMERLTKAWSGEE
jgi:hypothetical protein